MDFRWTQYWVQVHNVPLICMSKNIGLLLGRQLGTVKEIDVGDSGNCFRKLLRIRILVDVLKPLRKALRIKFDGSSEEKTLLLKYGRLPEHCFRCGFLRHSFKECTKEQTYENSKDISMFAYGAWLRASSPVKNRPPWSTRRNSDSTPNTSFDSQSQPGFREIGITKVVKIGGNVVKVVTSAPPPADANQSMVVDACEDRATHPSYGTKPAKDGIPRIKKIINPHNGSVTATKNRASGKDFDNPLEKSSGPKDEVVFLDVGLGSMRLSAHETEGVVRSRKGSWKRKAQAQLKDPIMSNVVLGKRL
ncbi:hypothetical protein JRO89_XS01G0050600 [Xanthoceras sorbifolium]|uniref:Zinc knuckle CX2CX4HX4C domain-containing protein n=1 Tax=Xanthoceras sorbifolium TaxID=99658 RepID=A0ABQ8IIB1_9ROSI|nr:hypothetical protein JRO89_XS01G0050600 [Xanthoceras sorbifolium]